MNNLKNLNLCLKPTGFDYLCPYCNAKGVYLCSIPIPRYIQQINNKSCIETRMLCMKCYKIIKGEKVLISILINSKNIKKENNNFVQLLWP